MYSMRQDQLNKRFRPYIGIAGGMAEVDSHSKVQVFDCKNAADPALCKTWKPGEGALEPAELPQGRRAAHPGWFLGSSPMTMSARPNAAAGSSMRKAAPTGHAVTQA